MSKKVVFCGTPNFACPVLQALHDDPAFEVTHVITQPDKPVGRKHIITPPPVKVLAEELKIPVLQPENINMSKEMRGLSCDYLVVFAYGQILSQELLDLPAIAPINIHLSLLPRHRGASPVQHALLAGDTETGITIQRMAQKLDTGPVLAQKNVSIGERDTTSTLLEQLSAIGTDLLIETLKNPLYETAQDESAATECKKLKRETGNVDPQTMTAEEIDRHVRALVRWPGVRMKINGKEAKVHETSLDPHSDALEVLCADGTTLYVMKMQSPGRNVVSGAVWQ